MNKEIPEEFKTKDREELYMDIIMLSNYINKLKIEIDDLKAKLSLKNGEVIKKRADNFKLKSELGYQAITINKMKEDKDNIIDINYEETNRDNSTE
jgi:regulator of replication initiation timing